MRRGVPEDARERIVGAEPQLREIACDGDVPGGEEPRTNRGRAPIATGREAGLQPRPGGKRRMSEPEIEERSEGDGLADGDNEQQRERGLRRRPQAPPLASERARTNENPGKRGTAQTKAARAARDDDIGGDEERASEASRPGESIARRRVASLRHRRARNTVQPTHDHERLRVRGEAGQPVQPAQQKQLLQHEEQAVIGAPGDVGPRRAVPQAAARKQIHRLR